MQPTAARGLRDFAAPLPLASPTPAISPTPIFRFPESWAKLVGKSFGDLMLEGNRTLEAGDYDRAIDINNFALTLPLTKGQAAVATMNRGNAYAGKGDFERAMRDLNESVTLDPHNAGGYVNRALILHRQGDTSGALKDYAEALRMDPKQWQAYFNRARDYAENGEFDKAIADLNKVLELRPKSSPALVARSALLLRKGNVDAAIADCDAVLRTDPKMPDALLARSRAYAAKADYTHAEKDIAALSKDKSLPLEIVQNSIAWIRATSPQQKLRNGREAVRLALAACEATRWEKWQCIDTLAAAYADSGDFERAKNYQEYVLSFDLSVHDRNKAEERLRLYQAHKPFRDEGNL